jgi:CRISPR-associated protein Cas2
MVVLILEKATASFRGELSRWMVEPRTGVFIGRISGMVRDKLWEQVCRGKRFGSAMMVYSTQTEQGFSIRTFGDPSRTIVDIDGLNLVRIPHKSRPTKQSDKEETPA